LTDTVQIAIIVAFPPTIAALGAVYVSYLNRSKLGQVEKQMNGRLTELLDLTRKASLAEGIKEGKESK
jgi:hypothetical protein